MDPISRIEARIRAIQSLINEQYWTNGEGGPSAPARGVPGAVRNSTLPAPGATSEPGARSADRGAVSDFAPLIAEAA